GYVDDVAGQYAIRSHGWEWLDDKPPVVTGSAIHQINCRLAAIDGRILVTTVEAEFQAGQRRPGCFDFGTPNRGIEVQIDGCAINNLGNLIILVFIIEDISIQSERAIQRAVFRSQFKRVVEFRFEGQWMRLVAWRCETGGSETERYNTWRVRAAALVTMRKRSIDQGLIRKVEL